MIKKLLLLGLLRGRTLHGYGVVDYLNSHATGGAAIGKSNAYRLLRVMEDEGLITSASEREGNRPERYVYEVTQAGEEFFQATLLQELANDATDNLPGIAILNYLDEVEPGAAAVQLQLRLDRLVERRAGFMDLPADVLELHPALDLGLLQIEVEVEWLESKIKTLRKMARTAA